MKIRKLFVTTVVAIAAASTWAMFSQSASAQYPGPGPVPVFTDNFGASTINQTSTPGGTPTSSFTSYDLTSPKTSTTASIAPGDLNMALASSSSAFVEGAAVFTATPVVLQNTGDYIDFILEFTDTANLIPSSTQNELGIGLFNSGGVAPITTNMTGGGTFTLSGGVQTWQGYGSQMYGFGGTSSKINERAPQTAATGSQDLLFNDVATATYDSPKGSNLVNGAKNSALMLTNGAQYTEDFQISLTGASQISVTNSVFAGLGTGGPMLYTYGGVSNVLPASVEFDSLAFGLLEKSSLAETQDISLIEITTNIPEPSTMMLLAAGLAMMVGLVSRRRS